MQYTYVHRHEIKRKFDDCSKYIMRSKLIFKAGLSVNNFLRLQMSSDTFAFSQKGNCYFKIF
jgi:hypothetical protein